MCFCPNEMYTYIVHHDNHLFTTVFHHRWFLIKHLHIFLWAFLSIVFVYIKTTYWSFSLAIILNNIFVMVNRIFKNNRINKFFFDEINFPLLRFIRLKTKINNFSCSIFLRTPCFLYFLWSSIFLKNMSYFL